MPTAKKTTTKKAPVKKPVKKVEPVVEETVEEPVEEEVPYEIASEKETLKHMKEGERVNIMFPLDPTRKQDDQFFELCVNGVWFRYPRGEVVNVPKDIAETFEWAEKQSYRTLQYYDAWKGDGKKLNY